MGRDRIDFHIDIILMCFNPRARMGRDVVPQNDAESQRGFNPRARMGRDRR